MEYVHNAQQILFITTDRINKYVNLATKNNKYKHLIKSTLYPIWNSPIYHAQLIYKYSELAYMKRRTNDGPIYLDKTVQNLTLFESSLQTFYSSFRKVIKDKFIILITEKIDKEKKLLKGVRNVSY